MPTATLSNPNEKNPSRAFSLQRYLLLHSQHDALQKHLSSLNAPVNPGVSRQSSIDSTSSSNMSTSPSETSAASRALPATAAPAHSHHRRFSLPAAFAARAPSPVTHHEAYDEVVEHAELEEEVMADEQKLMDVNLQIKMTLTELLNDDGVRGDRRYRTWVQTRLMDAEKEIRGQRRGSIGGLPGR